MSKICMIFFWILLVTSGLTQFQIDEVFEDHDDAYGPWYSERPLEYLPEMAQLTYCNRQPQMACVEWCNKMETQASFCIGFLYFFEKNRIYLVSNATEQVVADHIPKFPECPHYMLKLEDPDKQN